MIGIGLDITRAGQTVSFSPENLRVGTRVVQDFTLRPNRLYSDTAGTTLISGPGAEVAAMRDSRGVLVATQATAAARPKYAIQPAVGVRNRLRNNRGDGAVVGVLGSGGVLPAEMSIFGIAASSIEVLSIAAKNGRPNIKIRINGTPTGNVNITFAGSQVIPAVAGQVWTSSAWSQMTAGSVANLNPITLNTTTHAANGEFIGSLATNIIGTIGDDVRRVVSSTLVGATIAFVRSQFQLAWTSGAVDITLDISAQQLEQAGAATDVQIVGAGGFDLTEAGVRSLDVLVPDGFDDFMTLSSPFFPTGNFTLASAFDHQAGVDNLGIFGGTSARYGHTSLNNPRIDVNASANRTQFSENLTGRGVLVVRSVGAGAAQGWRNGVALTPVLTGSMRPLVSPGFIELFRAASVFASGRFFAGVLIDEGDTPLTDAERLMTQRYLAYKGGITL